MSLKCTHAWHMVSKPAHAHVAPMHPCLELGKHTRPRESHSNAPMHPPTRTSPMHPCLELGKSKHTRPRARRSNAPMLGTGEHTHPRARGSNAPMPGTWYALPPTRTALAQMHPMPASLKSTHAWHMVSTPAQTHVAQTHPCLALGKHIRPRACRSNAPMPGTW